MGESYGTYLGTIYATLFPERVRAIVLDGAIDPTADGTAVALGQARGFEGALDDFLADCAKQRGCAFYHDGKPGAAYDALRARAERTGLPTVRNAGRTVNGTRFDAAVIQALYAGRAGWQELRRCVGSAPKTATPRRCWRWPTASSVAPRAGWSTTRSTRSGRISCLDGPLVGDVDAAARLQALATQAAPRARRLPRELQPRVLDLARAAGHRPGAARRRRRAAAPRGRHHR